MTGTRDIDWAHRIHCRCDVHCVACFCLVEFCVSARDANFLEPAVKLSTSMTPSVKNDALQKQHHPQKPHDLTDVAIESSRCGPARPRGRGLVISLCLPPVLKPIIVSTDAITNRRRDLQQISQGWTYLQPPNLPLT